jgi:fucose 4-O-acetylase-like acetyltransferase
MSTQATSPGTILGKRYGWIDYARGIAIVLIVVNHMGGSFINAGAGIDTWLTDLFQTVYYSRMPLFFIVSGLFVRRSLEKRGLGPFVQYKFATILYPYFVWGGVQVAFQVLAYQQGLANMPRAWGDLAYLLYNPHGLGQFWFLYVLFAVAVLFALAHTYAHPSRLAWLVVGLVGYLSSSFLPPYFGAKTIAEFFFFLIIGDWVSRWFLAPANYQTLGSAKLLAVVLPIFLVFHSYLYFHFDEVGTWPRPSWQRVWLMASVFAGLALMFNLSFLLDRLGWAKWLRFIGNHSLYIYMLHIIVGAGARAILLKLGGSQYPNIAFYLTLGLAIGVPIAFYQATKRLGWWFLFSLQKKAAGD